MSETPQSHLEPPRFVDRPAMLVAGINERYTHTTRVNIPRQWERFGPRIGTVPGQVGGDSYGVCWNFDAVGSFDYLSCVEVSDTANLLDDLTHISISAHHYAVFTHGDHVSKIPETIMAIWGQWARSSGRKIALAPSFERYGANFDAKSGTGEMEIWIPIET